MTDRQSHTHTRFYMQNTFLNISTLAPDQFHLNGENICMRRVDLFESVLFIHYSFDTYFVIVVITLPLPLLISSVFVYEFFFLFSKAYLSYMHYDLMRTQHTDTSQFTLQCWLSMQNSIKCCWIFLVVFF